MAENRGWPRQRAACWTRAEVSTATAVDHQMHVCLRGWLAFSFDPAAPGVHHDDVAGGHPVVFQADRGYRDQASGRYPHP